MANILAALGILTIVGLGYPALLTLVWLLAPGVVDRAGRQLDAGLGKSFWRGALLMVFLGLLVAALLSAPFGTAKLLGWGILAIAMAASTIGAAGLAATIGARLRSRSNDTLPPTTAFLHAALAMEFGAALPVVGWVCVLPAVLFLSLGSAAGALLGRRAPGSHEPAQAPAARIEVGA